MKNEKEGILLPNFHPRLYPPLPLKKVWAGESNAPGSGANVS